MLVFALALIAGVFTELIPIAVNHHFYKDKYVFASSFNTFLTAIVLYVFVGCTNNLALAIPYLLGVFIGGVMAMHITEHLEEDSDADEDT